MNEELISTTQNRWHVRTSIKKGHNRRKDMPEDTMISELVYGQHVTEKGKNDVTITRIEGEVHHTLTGPTGEKSCQRMADDLNHKGTVPPEGKPVKSRVDGWKQTRKDDTGADLLTGEMLQKAISYK